MEEFRGGAGPSAKSTHPNHKSELQDGAKDSPKLSEKRWWERPTGIVAIGLLVTVVGGLILWGITRRYDTPTPSPTVAQPQIQHEAQATQPEAKLQEKAPAKSTHKGGTTGKAKIDQHGVGNRAIGGSITTGPCSNVQVGGSGNQATTNCEQPLLVLTHSLRPVIPPDKGLFQFKPEECSLKTQIRIVPNQKVPPPIQVSLDFDNPVTKIAATVENVSTLTTGGVNRAGLHALASIGSPGIGPNNALLVEVCSDLPVKLIAPPRVD